MSAAFDYNRQAWVDGHAADSLRQEQVAQELALLRGPRGAEYARFCQVDRDNTIARLEYNPCGLPLRGGQHARINQKQNESEKL